MDFFAQQDSARKSTLWLVVYFAAAVVGIVAAVYFVCLMLFAGARSSTRHRLEYEPRQIRLWHPQIFSFAAGGALAVIGLGSLWKLAQLSGGGKVVAESLGGRQLSAGTTDPDERKLLNVVEEMALASGVPVPPVYVMDREAGINAFAAGRNPNDAVIGVTRGCLKSLKRNELQGVIGHEFSHILNGDMRLNLRLMGIIFGIVCFTVVGREMLRVRGGKEGNAVALLGLALMILGFVGAFFASLIQAAVSRQREFLADASAVQFTRNPAGLSSALQKIGGIAAGSRIDSGHAQEASHMFFSIALGASALSGLATHPSLEQRIRAIDPSWDGKYPHVAASPAEDVGEALREQPRRAGFGFPPIMGGGLGAATVGLAPQTVRVQNVLPTLGNPTQLHLRYAESLREDLPEVVRVAARNPLAATALVYTLLLSSEAALRAKQLAGLEQRTGATVRDALRELTPALAPLAARARLPLVELALPALRELRPDEYQVFVQILQWLVTSDRQVDLFEFVLQRIIGRQLAPHFTGARASVVQYYSLRPVIHDCTVLISALAQLNQPDQSAVARAFSQGAPYLGTGEAVTVLLPREQCGLVAIDAALNRLAQAVPQIKKNVIAACVHVVGADGLIQEREAELLRAIADSLDCPIPPFVTMD